jgi:hypothetical protein
MENAEDGGISMIMPMLLKDYLIVIMLVLIIVEKKQDIHSILKITLNLYG